MFFALVVTFSYFSVDVLPTHSNVNVLTFSQASTQLFNDPYEAWDDNLNIQLKNVNKPPLGSDRKSVVSFLTHCVCRSFLVLLLLTAEHPS